METILQSEMILEDSEVLKWALANRHCKITEVPHWVIMALGEDIVHCGCHLVEQLVIALDGSQNWVVDKRCFERAIEKLMTNVLLASLHEDGNIELSDDFVEILRLFDFNHEIDIRIDLAPSGQEPQIWGELDLLGGAAGALHQQ